MCPSHNLAWPSHRATLKFSLQSGGTDQVREAGPNSENQTTRQSTRNRTADFVHTWQNLSYCDAVPFSELWENWGLSSGWMWQQTLVTPVPTGCQEEYISEASLGYVLSSRTSWTITRSVSLMEGKGHSLALESCLIHDEGEIHLFQWEVKVQD